MMMPDIRRKYRTHFSAKVVSNAGQRERGGDEVKQVDGGKGERLVGKDIR